MALILNLLEQKNANLLRSAGNFDAIQSASYAVADADLPAELEVCKRHQATPAREVYVAQSSGSVVGSSTVSEQCGTDSTCILPLGLTLQVDSSLNLGKRLIQNASPVGRP